MKSSVVTTRLATLAVAAMVLGCLGTAPVFATSGDGSTARNSAPATEPPAANPTTSALPDTEGMSSQSPGSGRLQPAPTSDPSPSSGVPSSVTPLPTIAQRPTDGGAVMGQAGKQASNVPSMLSRQFSALSDPTVAEQPKGTEGNPLGLDVSGWQKNVGWASVKNSGARFAYVKSSEGPWTLNDYFSQQYDGAANVGLLRGAYHFARPNLSSGASQAQVMIASGGGWSADGRTLPPALDMEDNPYVQTDGTNKCYGMSPSALVRWATDFTNTIKLSTGKDAVIYTSYYFWQECFGSSNAFANSNPLWIAAYGAASNNLWMPGGWPQYTFWQYADAGTFPGDQNVFNGTFAQLQTFAATASSDPATLLVKSRSRDTIYLVSGSTKYAIPDWSTFLRYQGVGNLLTLDDEYVDSLKTGSSVGRFVRSPDGTISLLNGGSLHRVPSCSMMNDFGGGQCTGWVPLSNTQLAQFPKDSELANAVTLPGGHNIFVSGGTTREFFDATALSQAGLPSTQISLSEDMFASMHVGTPIMRPDVIALDRASGTAYLYVLGQLHSVPTSINTENIWTRSLSVHYMDSVSLNQLAKSGPYTGWATNSAGTQTYLVGSATKYQLSAAPSWSVSLTPMSDALLALTSTRGRISLPAAVSTEGSGDIYQLEGGTVRHVPDWTTLTHVFGSALPPMPSLPPMVMKNFTLAAGILPLGKLYVAPTSPTVYLADGTGSLIALPSFSIATQLGINGYGRIGAADLAPYKSSGRVLMPVLTCNGAKFIRLSGSFVMLSESAPSTSLLPSTSLAASTCRSLGIPLTGSTTVSNTVFVKDDSSSTVYLLQGKTKRPVTTWGGLVTLNGGNTTPVIAVYDSATLASIASGSPA